MVNLFSKPGCIQCKFAERDLVRLGIPYQKVNVLENTEALAHIKELGYSGLPVLERGEVNFQGFKPDKIKALAEVA